MKIIAQFESDFAKSISPYDDAFWVWGLGDDGELYVQCCTHKERYMSWRKFENTEIGISFKEMRKVVAKFGKLMSFL